MDELLILIWHHFQVQYFGLRPQKTLQNCCSHQKPKFCALVLNIQLTSKAKLNQSKENASITLLLLGP